MESYNLNETLKNNELKQKVEEESGSKLTDCYQCGKCTAGCPVSFAMDNPPRKIIRLLQLGLEEEALHSHSLWLCSACDTCHARCPHGINISGIMESVRIEADRKGIKPEKTLELFDDLFLKLVEKYGRLHEMGLIARYNVYAMKPFQDADLAPKLLSTGKISPFPHKINDNGAVKKIFENVRKKGGNV